MVHHEKRAFLNFFFIYFISVALLILIAGFFYFLQMKNHYLKQEQFSLIEYARAIKTGNNLDKFSKEYSYNFKNSPFKIDIKNFKQKNGYFIKYIPIKREQKTLQVKKSTKEFEKKLFELKLKIALVQLILLFLFGVISYKLAKNAIKPLQKSITTLDKFAKDLIHDLNTPVTSIKLNMKLLKDELNSNKPLQRINKSVSTISELYENLTILLQEETFQMQQSDVCKIIQEIIQIQKQIYPEIRFEIQNSKLITKINPNAMKQIAQNLISNACKYNKKGGYVKIHTKDKKLYIEDSGVGIKEPSKIFDRSFSEQKSSGIGLDIVKRLALAMNIEIEVISNKNGTTFILSFNQPQ